MQCFVYNRKILWSVNSATTFPKVIIFVMLGLLLKMSRMFNTCTASELFFVDSFSIFLTQTLNQLNTIPVCITILTLCNFIFPCFIFFSNNNNFCLLVIIHQLSTALGANFCCSYVPSFVNTSLDLQHWLLRVTITTIVTNWLTE